MREMALSRERHYLIYLSVLSSSSAQWLDHGRHILIAIPLGDGRFKQASCDFGSLQINITVGCLDLRIGEVLSHKLEQKIHCVIAVDHPRRDGPKQWTAWGTRLQYGQSLFPVESTALNPRQPLRQGCYLYPAEKVVDQLHLCAASDWSQMDNL